MESVENYCQIYINTQYVIGKWKAIPEEKSVTWQNAPYKALTVINLNSLYYVAILDHITPL